MTCVCIAAACAIISARPLLVNAADDSTNQVMIPGDIAIRKSGGTSFDTEHDALFDAEPGDTVDLGLTLNTTQIKQQMQEYYDQAQTLQSNARAAVLHETASSFTATLSFPDSMDLSGVDAQAVISANLTSYDPKTGKYDNIYKDTSHAVIDSNYQLDQCGKFNITDVKVNTADNTISIQMDLDVSKLNYTGDNPAGTYAYGHLVCLYEAVENTPDYLAAVIPGIKIKDSYDGSVNTVSGTVNGQFKTYVGGGSFYRWFGQKMQFMWPGIQDTSMDGNDGTDANTDASGITLSYYNSKAVPKPEPTPTAEPTVTPEPTTTPEPTVEPSVEPIPTTTPQPTAVPTVTPEPTASPTTEPTPTVAPTQTPQTGVHTDLSAWIGILSCAVVVIAASLVLRHRNKHSR
jgi:cell division septation protein DedD